MKTRKYASLLNRIAIATGTVLAASMLCRAENWPRFRGPAGTGVTEEQNLPVKWSAEENVTWKTELPQDDKTVASPIVFGNYVFVATGIQGKPEHHILCINRADGKILWDTSVPLGPRKDMDKRAGRAPCTPCTDGTNVFAAFASGKVACLDMDGRIVWQKDLPSWEFDCSMGNSPLLYGDTLILINDPKKNTEARFLAYDKKTGELKISVERADAGFAHSTPILIKVDGKDQLIVAAAKAVQGIDPMTGQVIWFCSFGGETASPAYDGGLIYSDNGRGRGGATIKPGGTGDVTATALKTKFSNKSDLGSPVVLGSYVYRQQGEILQCMELETGKIVYTNAVSGANSWSSPFAARDGKVYVGNAGKCYVIKAGPIPEVISINDLGEDCETSAAVSDGQLFLRGTKHLWCIGKRH